MTRWQRWFSRKKKWEQDMNDELRFHIERQTAANVAAGLPPGEARRQALLQFGALEGLKENCREQRGGFWLETFCADVRYGLRILRHNPGLTAVAILTLALGIGATSPVFSAVDSLQFSSLPYPQAAKLVSFGLMAPIERNESMLGSNYVDWRLAPGAFQSITSIILSAD